MSTTVLTCDDPLDTLAGAVGADTLITDPAELEYLSYDVFSRGAPLLAAFRPLDKHALARGIAVVPRGGGMSYIGGYLAPKPGALLIDMSAMNRVLEIDALNMTATVEAGCTWAELRQALRPHGLRALAWGTLSGLKATIGGRCKPERGVLGCATGSSRTVCSASRSC